MNYLVSNSRTFTIRTHFADSPNVLLTRKFIYSYLRAKELSGRGEIRFEAYFLMMYHDHAFQLQGLAEGDRPGNNIVPGSRAGFKALLGNMSLAFFTSIHDTMDPVYGNLEAFATPAEDGDVSNQEFRLFLSVACLLIGRQIKVEVELTFMYLLIALSKGSAIDARFILRKIKSFKTQRSTSFVFDEMDPECIVQFNGLLNDLILDEKITIQLIVESLNRSLVKLLQ